MKRNLFLLVLFTILGVLSACTVQVGATKAKALQGRVLIGATRAVKGVAKPVKPAHSTSRSVLPRTAMAVPRARNLSASTDISSMSYTVTDTGSAGEAPITASIDPSYPFIDLFLTPGESYRIVVDVAITATAPGTNVGVTRYGDQADFTVDPNYDTYVNLTVHPSKMVVFDPASILSASGNVAYYDPGVPTTGTKAFLGTGKTMSAADKFFYSPDAKLYYFNKSDNAIYLWPNIASGMSASNKVLGSSNLAGSDTVQIFAACSDPTLPSTLWVVGQDTTAGTWNYYEVDVSATPNVLFTSSDITADLADGLTTPTIVPTGIAVDSTYSDVDITFYSTNVGVAQSGLLSYYSNSLYTTYPLLQTDRAFTDSSSSIYTDVSWDQGKLWVLASPNTSTATPGNTGRADILTFDDFINPLTTFPTALHQDYSLNGKLGNGGTPANTLYLPNRFAGSAQGSFLYFSQWNYSTTNAFGDHVLSRENTTNNTILDVTTKVTVPVS